MQTTRVSTDPDASAVMEGENAAKSTQQSRLSQQAIDSRKHQRNVEILSPLSTHHLSQRTSGGLEASPIKFIEQKMAPTEGKHFFRSGSVLPYSRRNRFGDKVLDQVRMLRMSWDKHVHAKGAGRSGHSSKLIFGESCLRENNYIRFEKQTNRDDYQNEPSWKAQPGRFLYMPESDFTRVDKKTYNIDFSRQLARNTDKLLGIDPAEILEQ